MQVKTILLYPFSLLYACIILLRNKLYDWNVFSSKSAVQKTIVVGNLSLGGTGKTPFTEYLLNLCSKHGKPGVVSRGYGRSTRGYLLADKNHHASEIGDEPKQILTNFPDVKMAVCEDRLEGIQRLCESFPDLDHLILDDAFQHRRLKGDLNILLTTYEKPYFKDHLLPAGSLRDTKNQRLRANIVMVSKCPPDLKTEDRQKFKALLDLPSSTPVYFSCIESGGFKTAFENQRADLPNHVVLLSSIAQPEIFERQIQSQATVLNHLKFADHHRFTPKDVRRLRELIDSFAKLRPAVVTTQKDVMRLLEHEGDLKDLQLLYQPIKCNILEDEKRFRHEIIDFLSRN